MSEVDYWKQHAANVAEEYEQILQTQRDELQRLQQRCTDLLHERSMMKAATATDVRSFCINYQAAKLAARAGTSTMAGTSFAPGGTTSARGNIMAASSSSSSSADVIPVHDLLQFLHEYSNGLTPPPDNRRKRDRNFVNGSSSSVVGVSGGVPAAQRRIYQRMMVQQRQTAREAEMEEWFRLQQQQEQEEQLRMEEHQKQQRQTNQQHADPATELNASASIAVDLSSRCLTPPKTANNGTHESNNA